MLLLEIQTLPIEDKATFRTLSLGCPNLWCHSNHLFGLFTCKPEWTEGRLGTTEGGFWHKDDTDLKWEDDLMKFLE